MPSSKPRVKANEDHCVWAEDGASPYRIGVSGYRPRVPQALKRQPSEPQRLWRCLFSGDTF